MDKSERKKVRVSTEVANEILDDEEAEITWDGETIVVTKDDIPYYGEDDCCVPSAHLVDHSCRRTSTRGSYEECIKCGRVFDRIDNFLDHFNQSRAGDHVILYVPRKEFLSEDLE